jgi:hypothetical protein
MIFKIKLTTTGGGERNIELPATSVQDAVEQIKKIYPDHKLKDINLIPSRKGTVVVYSNGDQEEIDTSSIYYPF